MLIVCPVGSVKFDDKARGPRAPVGSVCPRPTAGPVRPRRTRICADVAAIGKRVVLENHPATAPGTAPATATGAGSARDDGDRTPVPAISSVGRNICACADDDCVTTQEADGTRGATAPSSSAVVGRIAGTCRPAATRNTPAQSIPGSKPPRTIVISDPTKRP